MKNAPITLCWLFLNSYIKTERINQAASIKDFSLKTAEQIFSALSMNCPH